MTGGKWKEYHEPKFLRSERKVTEERLQQIVDGQQQQQVHLRQRIGPQQRGDFQPQTRRAEQWTVDPFWDLDRPTSAQPSNKNSRAHHHPTQDRNGIHRSQWKKEKLTPKRIKIFRFWRYRR